VATPRLKSNPAALRIAAARRAAGRRFLGEELSPEPEPSATPWLVRAAPTGACLELTEDGLLPAQDTGVLPLRHGVDAHGAPAACLLQAGDLDGLRDLREADLPEVECGACRAWRARRRDAARRAQPDVLDRLRTTLDEVFHQAA
jgi:hypothetical protein